MVDLVLDKYGFLLLTVSTTSFLWTGYFGLAFLVAIVDQLLKRLHIFQIVGGHVRCALGAVNLFDHVLFLGLSFVVGILFWRRTDPTHIKII